MAKRHVIIGNGGAAISAIRAVRASTDRDEIFLISEEDSRAYSPMLTTYFLSGKVSLKDLFICDAGFYEKNKVQTSLGRAAIEIVPSAKEVKLKDGASLSYDSLLIATGCSPILPDFEGMELPHVTGLRTLADARRIKTRSRWAKDIVVLGGGLVSLQVINSLYRPGSRYTLVVSSPRILSQTIDEGGAAVIQERLERFGVRIIQRKSARAITRKELILSDGSKLTADLVIVGKGVAPNISFLKGTGIKLNQGIIVDEFMRTNVEDVYGAGDVAESHDPVSNQNQLNFTWPNAIEQGRVAGLSMAGRKSRMIRNIRMNVSSIFGLTFASFGHIHEEGEKVGVVRKDGAAYRKLFFKDHLLIGGVLVGELNDVGILLNFVEQMNLHVNLKTDLRKRDGFWTYCRSFGVEEALKVKKIRRTLD